MQGKELSSIAMATFTMANGRMANDMAKEPIIARCSNLLLSLLTEKTEMQKDVCQYEGTWLEGEFADGLLLFKDGSTFRGTFKDSQPEVDHSEKRDLEWDVVGTGRVPIRFKRALTRRCLQEWSMAECSMLTTCSPNKIIRFNFMLPAALHSHKPNCFNGGRQYSTTTQ